jgi:hypothetical protein
MPRSGVDVLPAVRLEERGLDGRRVELIDPATARRDKVGGVTPGLRAQNAIHRGHELDELVDSAPGSGSRSRKG